MKLEHDDPRVIDYALGELDEPERAEIAAALLDPENEDAAEFAREMASLTSLSRTALKEEAAAVETALPTDTEFVMHKLERATRVQDDPRFIPLPRMLAYAAMILVLASLTFSTLSTNHMRKSYRETALAKSKLDLSMKTIRPQADGGLSNTRRESIGDAGAEIKPSPLPGSEPGTSQPPHASDLENLKIKTITRGMDTGLEAKNSPHAPNVSDPPRMRINESRGDDLQRLPAKTITRGVVEDNDISKSEAGKAKQAASAENPSRITSGGTLLAPSQLNQLMGKPGPTPRLDGTRAESSDYDESSKDTADYYTDARNESTVAGGQESTAAVAIPNRPISPDTNMPVPGTIPPDLEQGYSYDAISTQVTSAIRIDAKSLPTEADRFSKHEAVEEAVRQSIADSKLAQAGKDLIANESEILNTEVDPQLAHGSAEGKARPGVLADQLKSLGYVDRDMDFRSFSNRRQPDYGYSNEAGPAFVATTPLTFKSVAAEPLSTFAADVDTASYALIRRMLQGNSVPGPEMIRPEEFINYFDYAYPEPTGEHPFSVTVDIAGCPWAPEHRLARVGIKGKAMDAKERPSANLVFLVDVSGSMDSPDKLPLVRESLKGLLSTLKESDRVGIVTYAGESRVALEPTSCEKKADIVKAIDSLTSGGSTNGAGGLTTAYELAQRAYFNGGINRVIIATDGDFNVGVTSHDGLLQLITDKAKSGVFLSVLGYGMGDLMDSTLEMLADKGNGFYAYIDDIAEARRVLVDKGLSAIATIAKDVKFQIEFNPAKVGYYRQIGYENRQLAAQDFNDDTKDAGDIGPGHTVTALYEIVPAGKSPTPGVDPLKYQQTTPAPANDSPEAMTVKLRYKQPDAQTSKLLEVPVVDNGTTFDAAPQDFRFAAAVAAFAEQLKRLQVAQPLSLDQIQAIATATKGSDPARQEFVDLVVTTKTLAR